MTVYVVTGVDGDMSEDLYGVFSTRELAEECMKTVLEEIDDLSFAAIEEVELDAFGHR